MSVYVKKIGFFEVEGSCQEWRNPGISILTTVLIRFELSKSGHVNFTRYNSHRPVELSKNCNSNLRKVN